MGLIDGRGVLGPVCVDIGALMDVLPHLLLCRCVLHPRHNLLRILPNDGADPLPATLAVADEGKILPREHPGVLQHPQVLLLLGRQLVLRDSFKPGDLVLDLRLGYQVFPLQCLQLAPAKPRTLAELNQLVIVGLGEMLVAHPVPAAPFDLPPVSLGGLEIGFIVRLDAVELAQGLGLHLHRPGRQALVYSRL